jgi:WD40 repeat protein
MKRTPALLTVLFLFLSGLPTLLHAQTPPPVGEALPEIDIPKRVSPGWPHPGGEILAVSFSPDGKTALSVNSEGMIKFWDVDSGRTVWSINFDIKASSAAFFKDRKVALAKDWDQESTIVLLDIKKNREIETVSGHKGSIKTLSFSPNGESILSGGWDKEVMLWGGTYGDLSRIFKGHTHLRGMNPIGLMGDLFGDLFRFLGRHKYHVNAAVISPNSMLVAAGGSDGKVTLWEMKNQSVMKTMTAHKKGVTAVAFSSSSNRLLTGGTDTIKKKVPLSSVKVWNVLTGKRIAVLGNHPGEVTTVAFSPDGKTALSGDKKGTMKLWDLDLNREIRTFEGGEVLKGGFSPNGKQFITGGEEQVKLWDPSTGSEVGSSPFLGKGESKEEAPKKTLQRRRKR